MVPICSDTTSSYKLILKRLLRVVMLHILDLQLFDSWIKGVLCNLQHIGKDSKFQSKFVYLGLRPVSIYTPENDIANQLN